MDVKKLFQNETTRLANVCLGDIRYKLFLNHEVAAAILYRLREFYGIQPVWSEWLADLCHCSPKLGRFEDILKLLRTIRIDPITTTPLVDDLEEIMHEKENMKTPVRSSAPHDTTTDKNDERNPEMLASSEKAKEIHRASPVSVTDVDEFNQWTIDS
jgi:hypothetical protein